MASFDIAVKKTLHREGLFSDDADDRGGPTKYGISSRFLRLHKIKVNIRIMDKDEAIEIYRKYFWLYGGFQSQAIASKVFDIAVHSSPYVAHRLLQLSLRGIGIPVKVDTVIIVESDLVWTPDALLALIDYSSSAQSWFSPFYYSIVTYTTLGFGDITPQHWIGEIIVVAEVVLGYTTLGLLLSILANRVARQS